MVGECCLSVIRSTAWGFGLSACGLGKGRRVLRWIAFFGGVCDAFLRAKRGVWGSIQPADAGRRGDGDGFVLGFQRTGCGINGEDRDIVAGHVRAEEPAAVWGDEQVLRAFPEAGFDVEQGQCSVWSDLVGGDAVVAAVGAVQVFAVGCDLEVCGVAFALEAWGQGWEGLFFGERAFFGVVVEDGEGVGEFIDGVEQSTVGMERDVAWAGCGGQFCEGLGLIRGERAFGGVEPVDHDLVDAEVCSEGEPVIGADDDAVGVGAFLAFWVTACSRVLDERGGFLERTVGLDGKGGDVAGRVVGNEDGVVGGIRCEVAGGGSAGGGLVQSSQFAVTSFDGVGSYVSVIGAAELCGIDGVQVFAGGRDGEEEGVLDVSGAVEWRESALFRVEAERMDAGFLAGGEGGDEDHGISGRGGHCEQEEGKRGEVAHGFSRVGE